MGNQCGGACSGAPEEGEILMKVSSCNKHCTLQLIAVVSFFIETQVA